MGRIGEWDVPAVPMKRSQLANWSILMKPTTEVTDRWGLSLRGEGIAVVKWLGFWIGIVGCCTPRIASENTATISRLFVGPSRLMIRRIAINSWSQYQPSTCTGEAPEGEGNQSCWFQCLILWMLNLI